MSFGRSGTDAILEIIYHNFNPHITDEQGKELSVELFGGGWRKMKEVKHPRSLMIRYFSEVHDSLLHTICNNALSILSHTPPALVNTLL